jgi:hypothetical protein
MLTRIRNISSILLITLFAALCIVPGLKLLQYDGDTLSTTENRNLAALPRLPGDIDSLLVWPKLFEDFVTDHFGFRSELVRFYNLLHVKLGVSPISRALVGKDGWLFLEQTRLADSNRGALPLSSAQLERLMDSFESRHRYLESRQKKLVVFPVPDKNSLYPEFLPDSVKIVGPSRLRQFRDATVSAEFQTADTLTMLESARQQGEAIYYQTDSHWNCRGAWFAYLALMKRIRDAGYQGGRMLAESEVEFIRPAKPHNTDIVRNLLNLEGRITEPYSYVCRIRHPDKIRATRPSDGQSFDYIYAAPPGTEHRRYQHTEPRDHSRVLVYRDSYANAMVPFLIHSFDEVIYAAPSVTMGFDPTDIERYDPDLVIYEFVERSLFYPPDDTLLLTEPRSSGTTSELTKPGEQ